MKFFDKVSFKIFSIIILIVSLILGVSMLGLITQEEISDFIEGFFNEHFIWAIIILAVFIIWSLKNIISGGKNPVENSNGILLENKSGKLLITKESINNLIETVVNKNENISNTLCKLEFDERNNIIVYLTFNANAGISIKDITTDIQTKIKDCVKKTTDLDIKEVNIKIKNIEQ